MFTKHLFKSHHRKITKLIQRRYAAITLLVFATVSPAYANPMMQLIDNGKALGAAAVGLVFIGLLVTGATMAFKGFKIVQASQDPESKIRDATATKGWILVIVGMVAFGASLGPGYMLKSMFGSSVNSSQIETFSKDGINVR